MAWEKLPPQDPIEKFYNQLNSNYDVAQSYYKQRRLMLENLFSKDMQIAFSDLQKHIQKMIEEEWQQKVVKVVEESVSVTGRNAKGAYTYSAKKPTGTYEYQNYIDQVIGAIQRKETSNPKALLGTQFESFVKNEVFGAKMESYIQKPIFQALASLGLDFSDTGTMQSASALTKKKTYIRPDLGLGFSVDSTFLDEKGVLRDKLTNVAIELQEIVDLDNYLPENINNANILQQYLQNNLYGFSLKQWTDANGKTFAKSSILQSQLNSDFKTIDSEGNRHSWETEYAAAYANYIISKNLINIIGPMNVAAITGGGFEWFDDFVGMHLFYMGLQLDQIKNKERDGRPTIEGYPRVTKSDIFTRRLANQAVNHSFKANALISKNNPNKASIVIRTV